MNEGGVGRPAGRERHNRTKDRWKIGRRGGTTKEENETGEVGRRGVGEGGENGASNGSFLKRNSNPTKLNQRV